jgi:hypothetical protein
VTFKSLIGSHKLHEEEDENDMEFTRGGNVGTSNTLTGGGTTIHQARSVAISDEHT